MDDQQCYVGEGKREDTCPGIQNIADLAAERAAIAVFKKLGYNLDDEKDVKKLILLFDFIEKLSFYAGKGKITMFLSLVTAASAWLGVIVFSAINHSK